MDATGETGTAGGINGMILNGPGAAGVVPEAGPGGAGMAAAALSEAEKAAREAASQEELRRQEVLVAESCALNWREEPVFAKPVGCVVCLLVGLLTGLSRASQVSVVLRCVDQHR